MDLIGAGGRHAKWTNQAWRRFLSLAFQYGWEPAGTEAPDLPEDLQTSVDVKEWAGGYFSNDYQWVTDQDAANLADALERALPDIPPEAPNHKLEPASFPNGEIQRIPPGIGEPVMVLKKGEYLNDFEYFGGGQDDIRSVIAFCRVGGFVLG
jgi:hypothetical protein